MPVTGLAVRRQFLFVAQGRKASGRFVMLQGRDSRDAGGRDAHDATRFGLTASKKVGNAVARNRARRRLRHGLVPVLQRLGRPGWDYVAVARTATVDAPWQALLDELESLLERLHAPPARRPRDGLRPPAPDLDMAVDPGAPALPAAPEDA
jgi:ribonuclease P protein component